MTDFPFFPPQAGWVLIGLAAFALLFELTGKLQRDLRKALAEGAHLRLLWGLRVLMWASAGLMGMGLLLESEVIFWWALLLLVLFALAGALIRVTYSDPDPFNNDGREFERDGKPST